MLLAAVASCGLLSRTTRAENIQPATDRPQPKSPAESARCVKLPPGFHLDIVAVGEPLIREPSAMAFDALRAGSSSERFTATTWMATSTLSS